MVNVNIHGKLGEKFQKSWNLEVENIAEVIKAIDAQQPGFREHIIENDLKGVHYCAAIDDQKVLTKDGFFCKIPKKTKNIDFLPVPAGSAATVPALLVEIAKAVAIALVTSFIVSKLFAPPDPQDLKDADSYLFAGPVNVEGQGIPVPIAYGTLLVGGKVVSAINTSRDNPDLNLSIGRGYSPDSDGGREFYSFMKGTGGVPDTILDGRHYSWEQEWNTYLLAMERAFYKTQNRRETKIVDSSMGDLFVSNIFLRQNKSLQLGSQRTEDSPAG